MFKSIKHQSVQVFDSPNFIQKTTEKLAFYYIVAQGAIYDLQRRHSPTDLVQIYEKAERDWKVDPNNPGNIHSSKSAYCQCGKS